MTQRKRPRSVKAYKTTSALVERQMREWRVVERDREFHDPIYVPLTEIAPNAGDYEPSRVAEIRGAIVAGKTLPPVVLRRFGHQPKYEIRDGTHRDLASRELKLTHVPALVVVTARDYVDREATPLKLKRSGRSHQHAERRVGDSNMARADGRGEGGLPKLARRPGIGVWLLRSEWDVVERVMSDAADSGRPMSDAAFKVWQKLDAQLKGPRSR